jgi:hypothetical protein
LAGCSIRTVQMILHRIAIVVLNFVEFMEWRNGSPSVDDDTAPDTRLGTTSLQTPEVCTAKEWTKKCKFCISEKAGPGRPRLRNSRMGAL